MKASELRVGNWLYSLSQNMPFQIWATTIVQVKNGEANALKPIPLTEEWLKKFWFVRIRDYPVFSKQDIRIELNLLDSEWRVEILDRRIVVKYVHQLQNLYFALTGNELTIEGKDKEKLKDGETLHNGLH